MTLPDSHACPLTVSVVLYHSDLLQLAATLDSLLAAVRHARHAGRLGAVRLLLRDQSGDPAYWQSLQRLLADRDRAAEGVSLALCEGANAGYGAGHNALLAGVDEGLCLVLNPDVELAEDALSAGLQVLTCKPRAVLVCPRGETARGEPAHLAKAYPGVLVLALRAAGPARLRACFRQRLAAYARHDLDAARQPVPVALASGCCMLMRAATFAAVGGFDARYFLYFEDFDLSLRLAERGELLHVPAMRIRHHGGESAGKGWRHRIWFLGSAWRFFSTHGWRW